VRYYSLPGVLTRRGGAPEDVVMHVYLKSQPRGGVMVLRGFMFAESAEHDWHSLVDGSVCEPDVAPEAWPGITLRRARPGVLCARSGWPCTLRIKTQFSFSLQ
jgi:hypothetical protein